MLFRELLELYSPPLRVLENLPDWYRPFFERLKKNGSTENRTDLNEVGDSIIETSWDDDSYPPIY